MKRLTAWLSIAALVLVFAVGCQQQSQEPAEEMGHEAGEIMEEGMEAPADTMQHMEEAEEMGEDAGEMTRDS